MGVQILHLSCQGELRTLEHPFTVQEYNNPYTIILHRIRSPRLQCPVYLASELSNENSKLCTSKKSSHLTNNTVPSGGPRPNCGLFSSFYWAAQHFLLWAVFAAPFA